MEMSELEIDSTIFCDDVRREVGGKLFLVGVYISDFIVTRFPAPLNLVVHNQGIVVKPGATATSIIIKDEFDGILFESPPNEMTQFVQGRFALAHKFLVVVNRESLLKITLRNGSHEYDLPPRKVRLAPSPSAEGKKSEPSA